MQRLNLNEIFAKNIIYLRTKNNFTQLELAEKLNYSDKAVSRWERGEAIPDAKVLVAMSEIFGVTIDNMLKKEIKEKHIRPKINIRNFNNITGISFIGVWTAALLTFIILWIYGNPLWLVFVYALPVSLIVLLVFNAVYGRTLSRFFIVSLLVWSILAAVYLTAVYFSVYSWWPIFLLGIPAQIIVGLSFRIR
ncbi:MAG: helix-turn-helix transcriptional regulator [Clostridia bacterium]|nr:helix-turn-helix transcriptional regulator [Clostridia bacterium]